MDKSIRYCIIAILLTSHYPDINDPTIASGMRLVRKGASHMRRHKRDTSLDLAGGPTTCCVHESLWKSQHITRIVVTSMLMMITDTMIDTAHVPSHAGSALQKKKQMQFKLIHRIVPRGIKEGSRR